MMVYGRCAAIFTGAIRSISGGPYCYAVELHGVSVPPDAPAEYVRPRDPESMFIVAN